LSAKWFANNERSTSTAIALNFNQIGIATAFLVGGGMATTTGGLENYFGLIACVTTLVTLGTLLQFQNEPPVPPSTSELEKLIKGEKEPPFVESVQTFFSTKGFTRPLAAFICSISITNVVGVSSKLFHCSVVHLHPIEIPHDFHWMNTSLLSFHFLAKSIIHHSLLY
jgi:FLVCR family feline leukemia virus subgroup C receptor-related protein